MTRSRKALVHAGLGAAVAGGLLLGAHSRAVATECGDATRALAHFRAAAQVSGAPTAKEAAAQARALEKKREVACAPRTVSITALPLGYVSLPGGNLSKAVVDLPGEPSLVLTTQAGASGGIVFNGPAALTLPGPTHLETALAPNPQPGELLVAVALGAQLTVEEPQPGQGRWSISVTRAPAVVPLSKLEACAAGKDKPEGLARPTCQALVAALPPTTAHAGVPARGRAVPVGAWQYGWGATLDLGETELATPRAEEERPSAPLPPTRVALDLELSAPLPGISDGKRLPVTLEEARSRAPATYHFGHSCADDDAACEDRRFDVDVAWDRAFGLPFLRVPAPLPGRPVVLVGKVTDRLARPIANQRLAASSGDRRVVTSTDKQGEFRIAGLPAGEVTVVPVGRDPHNAAKGDETRKVQAALGETKVPVIFMNRLFE